jgi:hypothetical protein
MGFWVKQAVDVVISENTVYSHRPSDSSSGGGMGFQYAPERVWFLYNHIYDCDYGITSGGDSGLGTGQNVYYVGNVIHDIHTSGSFNPNSAWSNAGIMVAGLTNHYMANNTIFDVDAGINCTRDGTYVIENNIVSNVTQALGNAVFVEDSDTTWSLNNNLFWQGGSSIRVRFGSTVYNHSTHGHGSSNLNSNPLFVNSAGDDFHLQSGSPAVNAGRVSNVYTEFQSRYGLDIRVDPDGVLRPQGSAYDIGAYERP